MIGSTLDELLELVKGQETLERLAVITKAAYDKQRAVNEALSHMIEANLRGEPLRFEELSEALNEALK